MGCVMLAPIVYTMSVTSVIEKPSMRLSATRTAELDTEYFEAVFRTAARTHGQQGERSCNGEDCIETADIHRGAKNGNSRQGNHGLLKNVRCSAAHEIDLGRLIAPVREEMHEVVPSNRGRPVVLQRGEGRKAKQQERRHGHEQEREIAEAQMMRNPEQQCRKSRARHCNDLVARGQKCRIDIAFMIA